MGCSFLKYRWTYQLVSPSEYLFWTQTRYTEGLRFWLLARRSARGWKALGFEYRKSCFCWKTVSKCTCFAQMIEDIGCCLSMGIPQDIPLLCQLLRSNRICWENCSYEMPASIFQDFSWWGTLSWSGDFSIKFYSSDQRLSIADAP